MNIGIHSWTLETRHPLAEAMARAAALGYDGYEVDIGNFGNSGLGLQILPDRLQPDERAALHDAMDAAGIPICSLCLGALWHYPISSSEERLRARGIELVVATIALAADLGAACVLLPIDQPQGMSPSEAWTCTQTALETCIPAAEAAGVTLGIENVCSEFLWSAHDLARLVDSLSSPWCKVYYDVGNAAWIGLDPAEEIRFLGDRIARIHVKDRSHLRSYPDSQTISVGEPGIVNFPQVVEAIRHINYDGYIIVEVPTWNMDADRLAQQNLTVLRTLLA
jgi:L-ribulose-5-phosphate 3-epimerase